MTITVDGTYENGHLRLKGSVPLAEGTSVRVTITAVSAEPVTSPRSIADFLAGLPPGPRSYPTWKEVENNFQLERDAWER